jgi:hypothetical protein
MFECALTNDVSARGATEKYDSYRALSVVSYPVFQSLKKLGETGGLVACKERSVLQDQHLSLNPGLHFVSSGLCSLVLLIETAG